MIEQDPGNQIELTLNVKKGIKGPFGINTDAAGTVKHIIQEEDDNCGSRDLYYYDNPEQILQFPLEGVVVTLSENQ